MAIYNKLNRLFLRWKEVLLITILIKFSLIIFANILQPSSYFSDIWNRWDSNGYLEIAKEGYVGKDGSLVIVFYPLYPITIKLFSFLVDNLAVSSIVVSIIFSIIASIALFELTILDFSKKVAILSVWFMNIFPTAYFLQAGYTESLFLAISIISVYLLRKNLFILSGLMGFLASLTRVNGLILLSVYFMEKKITKQSLIVFLLTIFGFFSYLGINYSLFKNPFYFTIPLSLIWNKELDWPWNGITNLFYNSDFYILFSELAALILILFFGVYTFFKIRKSYGVYILSNLVLFTSTNFILSTPRYALILFPIFITLGNIKSKKVIISLSIVSMLLLYFFTFLYTHEGWAF